MLGQATPYPYQFTRVLLSALISLFLLFDTGVRNPSRLAQATATSQVVTLVVTNSTDVVNGNVSSTQALLKNPGRDGVSFREALLAAGHTKGPKSITFASQLAGSTIAIQPKGDILFLSSGDLTIDGDLNGDGKPDITLDGQLGKSGTPSGIGLAVTSSHNTIRGLNLVNFHGTAIFNVCPDKNCGLKLFEDNHFIGNAIRSDGDGISIGALGLIFFEEAARIRGAVWQDLELRGNTIQVGGIGISINPAFAGGSQIQLRRLIIADNQVTAGNIGLNLGLTGNKPTRLPVPAPVSNNNVGEDILVQDNTIDSQSTGIFLVASVGGGSRNHFRHITLRGNHLISHAEVALAVISADTNSAYFDIPGPTQYSDQNSIEDLTIVSNQVEAKQGFAIHIAAANYGNQGNLLKDIHVLDNTISNVKMTGILLSAGNSGKADRGTQDNLIDGVEIRGNQVSDTWKGIQLFGSFLGNDGGLPTRHNIMQNVQVVENTIQDFETTGIQVVTGQADIPGQADLAINLLTLQGNHILQSRLKGRGNCIELIGGFVPGGETASGGTSANHLSGVQVLENSLENCSVGVQISGGTGLGATDNHVEVDLLRGNLLDSDLTPLQVEDNMDGATGNQALVKAGLETPTPVSTPTLISTSTATVTLAPVAMDTTVPSSPAIVPTANVSSPDTGVQALSLWPVGAVILLVLAIAGLFVAFKHRGKQRGGQ